MTTINCLSEKHFLFCGLTWKCFVVYIISHKCLTKIFVWQSGLRLWAIEIISYNNKCFLYIQVSYTWVEVFFVSWFGLKTFLEFILSGKPIWRSGLKIWFLKQKCFFCYSSNSNKFQISCHKTDLIRQKSFSFLIKCLKASKIFQFFRHNLHHIKISFPQKWEVHACFLWSDYSVLRVHWHSALLLQQVQMASLPYEAKQLRIVHKCTHPFRINNSIIN